MKIDSHSLLSTFFDLVRIAAVALNERPVAEYVCHNLSQLEIPCVEDAAALSIHGNCGNIIARKPGNIAGEPLLLSAHMDSVKSTRNIQPQIKDGLITSDGNTILAADNRAGVAIILCFLEILVKNNVDHQPVEVVFSPAEEIGLLGVSALNFDDLRAKSGYVLDCSKPPGCFVVETPTAVKFNLEFQGRSAHAGVAPEKGVNAIAMAVDFLQKVPVGRVDEHTVVNVGTLQGGSATNVVAERVAATGEIRSFSLATIAKMKKNMLTDAAAVGKKFGGHIQVAFRTDFHGFKLDENEPVVGRVVEHCRTMGLAPQPLKYSGGSDANVYNQKGVPAVTLGIGMQNPHANNECIELADMVKVSELLLRVFEVKID